MILVSVWKVVVEWKYTMILGLWRRRIQSRARNKAEQLRALYNKLLLKCKWDRENFWPRHQKGAERIPPASLQLDVIEMTVSFLITAVVTSSLLMKERNVLKLRMAPGPYPKAAFWDNLGTGWFILGHKTIDLNLVEGQITIQTVSFTQIRGTISEYNMLVCQAGSEPSGRKDLKTESGVNA